MAKKYNPDVHSSVVSNYRRAYQEKYTQESTLSDERIWDISNEWVGLEGGSPAEDAAILEQMNDEQNQDPEITDSNKNYGQLKGVYDGVTSEQLLSWLESGLAEEFELNIESELTRRGICYTCGQLLATHNDDGSCVSD